MSKKLITACMALVALAAFALPAVASATNDPDLTHPTGTLLATGKKIVGTNIGITKFIAGETTVECNKDVLTGTLTKNNGSEVEGTIETASFKGTASSERCTSGLGPVTVTTNVGNGTPWCVRSTPAMVTDEVQIRGNGCANAARSITFVLHIATFLGTIECKYERTTGTGPIKGTYTTDEPTSDAIIHIGTAGSAFAGEVTNSGACPASGSLEMSITLETDAVATEPLYFS
jgi:hypothetical protein